MVELARDFIDLFECLNEADARYLLVGMRSFGGPPSLSADALIPREPVPSGFRFGRPPVSVDLLSSIAGIAFDEAWPDRVQVRMHGVEVPVIGLAALCENKRAAGRLKDLADLEALGAL